MSKVEKRRLAKLRQRFLCRKVLAIWKQFAIERRPRVLTETEEMQIRTIKKWHDKVNFFFLFFINIFTFLKVKARRLLKRSHSLELIDIINPERKNDNEETDLFDEDTEIAGLLQSKAKKKARTMTTESVRRLFTNFKTSYSFITF